MIHPTRAYPLWAVILIPILVSGCGLFSDGIDWRYSPMRPHQILSIETAPYPENVNFEIASSLSTPCHEYSHAELRHEGLDIFVKFYQRVDTEVRCTENLVDTEFIWNLRPGLRGEYTFHFWRSDSTSLDTTIIIR